MLETIRFTALPQKEESISYMLLMLVGNWLIDQKTQVNVDVIIRRSNTRNEQRHDEARLFHGYAWEKIIHNKCNWLYSNNYIPLVYCILVY